MYEMKSNRRKKIIVFCVPRTIHRATGDRRSARAHTAEERGKRNGNNSGMKWRNNHFTCACDFFLFAFRISDHIGHRHRHSPTSLFGLPSALGCALAFLSAARKKNWFPQYVHVVYTQLRARAHTHVSLHNMAFDSARKFDLMIFRVENVECASRAQNTGYPHDVSLSTSRSR